MAQSRTDGHLEILPCPPFRHPAKIYTNVRGTVGQTTSATFKDPKSLDYMSVSISWIDDYAIGEGQCNTWFDTVVDGCDFPNNDNPDNNNHGGAIGFAVNATLSIEPLVVRQIYANGKATTPRCNGITTNNCITYNTLLANIQDYLHQILQAGSSARSVILHQRLQRRYPRPRHAHHNLAHLPPPTSKSSKTNAPPTSHHSHGRLRHPIPVLQSLKLETRRHHDRQQRHHLHHHTPSRHGPTPPPSPLRTPRELPQLVQLHVDQLRRLGRWISPATPLATIPAGSRLRSTGVRHHHGKGGFRVFANAPER